jgi:SAM-dependent methyltransferase
MTPKTQLSENQKGEIEFRRKLYQQQVEGKSIFQDEYDASGIEQILQGRMQKTYADMERLREQGIPISPYIEIGAERGQRSLVMENDLGSHGAAVDISHDLLKSLDHYQRVFRRPKSPLRICCDANTLPFKTGSVPFVFCYETLHHFPEPAPIAQEALRVLQPGGSFFFDEEPLKQVLHFDLYRAKSSYCENLSRSIPRKALDRLFMKRTCNETEHGIIENDKITLGEWKEAFSGFDASGIRLQLGPIKTEFVKPRSLLKKLALYLFGGYVSGVCRKPGTLENRTHSIESVLACPSCRKNKIDSRLLRGTSFFYCEECSIAYPIVDGILFLFTHEKLTELYPGISSRSARSDD